MLGGVETRLGPSPCSTTPSAHPHSRAPASKVRGYCRSVEAMMRRHKAGDGRSRGPARGTGGTMASKWVRLCHVPIRMRRPRASVLHIGWRQGVRLPSCLGRTGFPPAVAHCARCPVWAALLQFEMLVERQRWLCWHTVQKLKGTSLFLPGCLRNRPNTSRGQR